MLWRFCGWSLEYSFSLTPFQFAEAVRHVLKIIGMENGVKPEGEANAAARATEDILNMLKKETGRKEFLMDELMNYEQVILEARKKKKDEANSWHRQMK